MKETVSFDYDHMLEHIKQMTGIKLDKSYPEYALLAIYEEILNQENILRDISTEEFKEALNAHNKALNQILSKEISNFSLLMNTFSKNFAKQVELTNIESNIRIMDKFISRFSEFKITMLIFTMAQLAFLIIFLVVLVWKF